MLAPIGVFLPYLLWPRFISAASFFAGALWWLAVFAQGKGGNFSNDISDDRL